MITLCIILFLVSCYLEADDKEKRYNRQKDYEISERRHKELVEAQKKRSSCRRTTRRIVKKGDVTLGEEIVEED